MTGDAVVLVNELVKLAVAQRASDIHLEPKHDKLQVRLRVDDSALSTSSLSPWPSPRTLTSRVKVLAKMDIAERRVPQDGQIALEIDGKRIHLRASTFPTTQGEKVVLRILSTQQLLGFDQLGFDERAKTTLRDVVHRPQGFVVTSGPTGAARRRPSMASCSSSDFAT